MGTLHFNFPAFVNPISKQTSVHRFAKIESPKPNSQFWHHHKIGVRISKLPRKISYSNSQMADQSSLKLRVPSHWSLQEPQSGTLYYLEQSQEAEWLRVTLHKWLDDEYCPEATNVEISRVAAASFYKSLVEKKS
ncbi:hypothetical protein Sango_0381700 [Sesamum angolense]|uniref:Uncharacterized protein n=1 Tax=Sesamum angolense TaxID=2727404 RepID=A0AAE1X9W0_9LAMI|nr:hypothetical protein Sango_0381700 [Sesamum angolense]